MVTDILLLVMPRDDSTIYLHREWHRPEWHEVSVCTRAVSTADAVLAGVCSSRGRAWAAAS
jgi:hypothetical protein